MLPGGLLPPAHAISFSDGPSHSLCSGACLCFSAGSDRSFSPRSKHGFLCCVLILTSGARTTCSTEPVLATPQAGNILCHVLSHVIPTTSSEDIIVISISKIRKWSDVAKPSAYMKLNSTNLSTTTRQGCFSLTWCSRLRNNFFFYFIYIYF